MATYKIQVPSLTLIPSVQFSESLDNLPDADEYLLDYSKMSWVEPLGMLLVASKIRSLVQEGRSKFSAINYQNNNYAAYMGFYETQGLKYGNLPGQANESFRYLPVTILDVDSIKTEARETFREVGAVIEKRSLKLARVLTQEYNSELVSMLAFSLSEILRNIVEHSQSPHIQYCAQYWPQKHLVEIAIMDTGIGVLKSLSQNPYLVIKDDKDALQLSLVPGISGSSYKGKPSDPNDYWANTGFGLYMTSRLCRNGGCFFIGSGNKGLHLKQKRKYVYDGHFDGTVIRLRFRTDNKEPVRQQITKFSKEGSEIAKIYQDTDNLTASKASRMLSDDFRIE